LHHRQITARRSTFRYPECREIDPPAWVAWWAARHGGADNPQYFELIAKRGKRSADDFERVGKWKEGCLKPGNGRWKTGTPTAYDAWMQAKAQLPKCPDTTEITTFLMDWSERTFTAGKDQKRKWFCLSRATTLLHFLSGGEYPILDSRVVTAMIRLGSPIDHADTIGGYLNSFCPLFSELAVVCGVSGVNGLRTLDNALFNYGAETSFSNSKAAAIAVKHFPSVLL
jgi:hypothetical protein